MITVYTRTSLGLRVVQGGFPEGIKPDMIWVDMLRPTPDEERAVEAMLRVEIPTREEAQEIELSSRLYVEGETTYLTATLLYNADDMHPHTTPVTFVLTNDRLITIRYEDPGPFRSFRYSAERHPEVCISATDVLLGLLDAVIERTADILERVQQDVDRVSLDLFGNQNQTAKVRPDESSNLYREILRREGRSQLFTLKIHECLVSIGRIVTFLNRPTDAKPNKVVTQRLKTLQRDITSLSEHTTHLADTLAFLQDATLGLINIQQNEIIKIFSIAAVVLLPPTLVASIYGMNFHTIPELSWHWGYPFALLLMLAAAFLPYWYFKRRGWF
jgi:magnesium transporter